MHLNIVSISNQQPTRLCVPHLPLSQTLHHQIYLQDKIQHLWHSSTVLFSQHRCSSRSHNETNIMRKGEKTPRCSRRLCDVIGENFWNTTFVARLELKLDSNLTNWTSCCFSMWSKRTTSTLAVGSWWPQEVIHAISAHAWERIILLFGRITYVMYLKEWHSIIWIKPAFQGYCFYFSTCTCLFFVSFLFFVIYCVIHHVRLSGGSWQKGHSRMCMFVLTQASLRLTHVTVCMHIMLT